jgi:hypothetical protein
MVPPGIVFPDAPELGPGDGVVEPGWVVEGARGGIGILLPEPVVGAVPVPVLPPLLWAGAGATIAATRAIEARMLRTIDAMAVPLGSFRSSL